MVITLTKDELLSALRSLPEEDRLELADALDAEASPAPEPVGGAGVAELARRSAEIGARLPRPSPAC